MPTCPNGHQSAADDWCEVCGHRMADAPGAPPAGAVPPAPPPSPPGQGGGYGYPGPPAPPAVPGPPAPPGPATHGGPGFPEAPGQAQGQAPGHQMPGHQVPGQQAPGQGYGYPGPGTPAPQQPQPAEPCPQCGTFRQAQAPFCQECRYNFLTGTPTAYAPPNAPQPQAPQQPGGFPPPAQPEHPGAPGQPGHQEQPPGPPPAPFPGQGMPGRTPPPGHPGAPVPPQPSYPGQPGAGRGQQFDYEASRPSQVNRPAEPLASEAPEAGPYGGAPQQPAYGYPQQAAQQPHPQQAPPAPPQHQSPQSGDWTLPPPGQQGAPGMPGQPPQPPQAQQLQQEAPQQPGPPPPPAPPQQEAYGPPQQEAYASPQQDGYGAVQDGFPQQPGPPPGGERQAGMPGNGMQPPQPDAPQSSGWTAVIVPDREYFTAMMERSGPEAASLNLPAYTEEQQLPLTGHQVTIGRRRQSTGEAPDIDLARTPEDPGVSHQHAMLVQQPDGSWSVVDQDSTNGTTINNAEDPIQPYLPVPLMEGDRVHVGAWTTITLRRS